MNMHRRLIDQVIAYLITSTIAVALLAGCSGGGGGDGGVAAPPVSTTSATITPFKGTYSSGGTVAIKDANGSPVALISGGTINSSGVAVVTFNASVAYPLIVEVTGSYYNEANGTTETATAPLRGIIISAITATSGAIPVTIVTETAVADLVNRIGAFSPSSPISAGLATTALNTVSALLGIPASAVPVINTSTHKTGDANTLRLAALAVAANSQAGSTLLDKVKALADLLVKLGGNPATTVISQTAYDNALLTVTSGPLSMMEAGATAPTPPMVSTSGYDTLYAGNLPTRVAAVWDQIQSTWDSVDWQ